jgi:hypothetical protein
VNLSDLATVVAAVAAVGAGIAAWQSGRAAASLTAIEQHRWHADLTPQFTVNCRTNGGDRAQLKVALLGPPGLDRLDQVTVTIRDDVRGRESVTAGGPTAEQIARQVWRPYRFVPRVDGADETGRSVEPFSLLLGDWRPLTLERTPPPPWSSDSGSWQERHADQPVRLTLSCYRRDHEPWTVPVEIVVEDAAKL